MTSDAADEYLERLWYMQERGEAGVEALRAEVGEGYSESRLASLVEHGLAIHEGQSVRLSEAGERRARRLIRSHRLAERLVHDVLGETSRRVPAPSSTS